MQIPANKTGRRTPLPTGNSRKQGTNSERWLLAHFSKAALEPGGFLWGNLWTKDWPLASSGATAGGRLFDHIRNPHFDTTRAQDTAGRVFESPRRSYPAFPAHGIDNPARGNAHVEVVPNFPDRFGNGVFGRKYFDAELGRCRDDLLISGTLGDHADIGYAESSPCHLNSLLRPKPSAKFRVALSKDKKDFALSAAVFTLAQMARYDLSIHIVAVRTVARLKVFFDRDQDAGCHGLHVTAIIAACR